MSIFGSNAPSPAPPVPPAAPPPPPTFGLGPQGKKPSPKSPTATFLGAEALPTQSAGLGYKTLLGA